MLPRVKIDCVIMIYLSNCLVVVVVAVVLFVFVFVTKGEQGYLNRFFGSEECS